MSSIADNKINFSRDIICDIPVLTCTNESSTKKPLIIFSHGFTGKKEDWRGHMSELAENGYYTVAVDNRLHGERKDAGLGSVISSDGKVNFCGVFKAIKENAEDIVRLINHFTAKTEIDQSRIGMVGVSMGGFTTFRAVVMDKRIKVAVPIIASPVWEDIPGDMVADDAPEIIREFNNLSKEYSPSIFVDKFYPTALFMQVGSKDKHFNVEKLKQFYLNVKDFYKNDMSKLELIIFDGIAHEFTEPMWSNAKSWLYSYL